MTGKSKKKAKERTELEVELSFVESKIECLEQELLALNGSVHTAIRKDCLAMDNSLDACSPMQK